MLVLTPDVEYLHTCVGLDQHSYAPMRIEK